MNLLRQPVFSVQTNDGKRRQLTLPEALAMLDDIRCFSRLRPHQTHAWQAFLTQLGILARAAYRDFEGEFDEKYPPDWRAALRELTLDYPADEPWTLVVEDATLPAFMQSPTFHKEDYTRAILTPDELDLLVTSKNHDVKTSVAYGTLAEDWVYALVSLQTTGGFSGAGNYGVSRMNGGFGNRSRMSLAAVGAGEGAVVKRDMDALREFGEGGAYDSEATKGALLWLKTWDGEKEEALSSASLHPLYVEVCRRLRLERSGQGYIAYRATSRSARVEPVKGGLAYDPWMPVNMKEQKVLSVVQGGFSYNRIASYLSGDWKLPALALPTTNELNAGKPMVLLCKALVRGQGMTEGYYERRVDMSYATIAALAHDKETLERAIKDLSEDASGLRSILRHALAVCAAAGEGPQKKNDRIVAQCMSALEERADEGFFDAVGNYVEELLGVAQDDEISARDKWARDLIDFGRDLLHDAQEYMVLPSIARYQSFAKSDRLYESRVRSDNKGFRKLFARNKSPMPEVSDVFTVASQTNEDSISRRI